MLNPVQFGAIQLDRSAGWSAKPGDVHGTFKLTEVDDWFTYTDFITLTGPKTITLSIGADKKGNDVLCINGGKVAKITTLGKMLQLIGSSDAPRTLRERLANVAGQMLEELTEGMD